MVDFKELNTPDKVLIGLAVFFSATISLPFILDLNNSGNTLLSVIIYSISGLLIIISGVIFFVRRINIQRKEHEIEQLKKYEITENDNNFLKTVKEANIPMEEILYYINHRSNRCSLLDHELFSSGHRKCLDSIERYKHYKDNEGHNFVVYKYNWAILKITIDRIKTYITNHYNIIDNDINKLDIDGFIELIYNIIKKENGSEDGMGYEDYAVNVIGIDRIFITEYNKIHNYAVEFLDNALSLIKTSNYSSDYNRYLSILNAVLLYLRETFSDNHIRKVFMINGRCESLYNKAKSVIHLTGKDFSDIISIK